MSAEQQQGGGCIVFVLIVLVVAAVVAGAISIAALVDPFSWLPSVEEVWADCREDYGTPRDDCALAVRFPGFWPRVIVNLAYLVAAVGLLGWLAYAVLELREARSQRFSRPEAVERYGRARRMLALIAAAVAVLAGLPIGDAVTGSERRASEEPMSR